MEYRDHRRRIRDSDHVKVCLVPFLGRESYRGFRGARSRSKADSRGREHSDELRSAWLT